MILLRNTFPILARRIEASREQRTRPSYSSSATVPQRFRKTGSPSRSLLRATRPPTLFVIRNSDSPPQHFPKTGSPSRSLLPATRPPTLFELRRGSLRPRFAGEDWWSRSGSNRRPRRCERRALSTELLPRTEWVVLINCAAGVNLNFHKFSGRSARPSTRYLADACATYGFTALPSSEKYGAKGFPGRAFKPATTASALTCAPSFVVWVW